MRPHSEVRVAVAAALVAGDGTCRELAQRTGWSIDAVRCALDNMVRSGDAVVSASVRRPGVCRPVPVYARAMRSAFVRPSVDVPDLIAIWAGLATVSHGDRMEAADHAQ